MRTPTLITDEPPRTGIDPTDARTWPTFMRRPDLEDALGLTEHQARRMLRAGKFGRTVRLGRYLGVSKAALLRALGGAA